MDIWISFHFLSIMSNAAANICVEVFLWMYVFIFFGIYLWAELLSHMATLCLTFKNLSNYIPEQLSSFYIPPSNVTLKSTLPTCQA